MRPEFVKLDTDKGPAWVVLASIAAVGAAFAPRKPGRAPSRAKKAAPVEDEDGEEAPLRRALMLTSGQTLYILDTLENIEALGLEDE